MFCGPGFACIQRELKSLPGNYLEIGVFEGGAISQLADQYPDKIIAAIDPFIEDGYTQHTTHVEKGQHMMTQRDVTMGRIKGKANIKFYEMTSEKFFKEVLTDELAKELNISAVLIDGSHWYDDVIIDVKIALKLIGDKKGIVIFDDISSTNAGRVYEEFLVEQKSRINRIEKLLVGHAGELAIAAVYLD